MSTKNKQYNIIGLDIGASYLRGVLLSDRGVNFCYKSATPKNKKDFIFAIKRAILEIKKFARDVKIGRIGIGIAGVSDIKKGILFLSPNIKFLKNFRIKEILKKDFNIPVFVDNDARCFARAEFEIGSGKNFKDGVCITLGSGVGGGIIIGGKVYYGHNYSAGEIGHMVLNLKTRQTFEDLASQKFLQGKKPNNAFFNQLGIGIANIINILNPEIIILGGGISQELSLKDLIRIKKIAAKFIVSLKSKNFKLKKSGLGEYAGAIGAALMAG